MKWPWQKAAENRGTLTYLADGRVVLGVPHLTDEEDVEYVRRQWEVGTYDKAKVIVFPWPVDVIDLRVNVITEPLRDRPPMVPA